MKCLLAILALSFSGCINMPSDDITPPAYALKPEYRQKGTYIAP
jgi:predicted phage gp36 major capsid-like protein